jgi:hypothetical protein
VGEKRDHRTFVRSKLKREAKENRSVSPSLASVISFLSICSQLRNRVCRERESEKNKENFHAKFLIAEEKKKKSPRREESIKK